MPSMTRRILVTAAAVLSLLSVDVAARAAGYTVTVTNGTTASPWIKFDAAGNALDAHDGEIVQFPNDHRTYYLYGTSYGCGYIRFKSTGTPFCGFVVYSSPDLKHWRYRGQLFDPHGTSPTDWQKICNSLTSSCYRPHVLYNAATHKYVLWVNTYDKDAGGVEHGYHVLTSSNPISGFTEAQDATGAAALPTLAFPTGGDFDLFQDNDAAHTGYIVYTVLKDPLLNWRYGYELVVERLSPDYTTGTGAFTTLDTRQTESPSMFKRGSTYYVTMSDPNCAYCGVRDGAGSGTGAAYLTAPSPLGPWRGATATSVQLSPGRMYVSGLKELYQGTDQTTSQMLMNLRDYDLRIRATALPDTFANTTVHYAEIGWMFRAQDPNNGYYWLLSNRPYKSAPSRLTKYVVVNGAFVKKWIVPVKVRLSTTTHTFIRTSMVGRTIKTWVKNTLVDTTKNARWTHGFAGIRELSNQSAIFDMFAISRPMSQGYLYYGGDNFQSKTFMYWPVFSRFRRPGVRFSSDSCGGQPSDVADLLGPTSGNDVYLFQSDRWDNQDQNEAQALQYWQALKFGRDGSVLPLTCAATSTMTVGDAPASGALATVAGTDTFNVVQDISATLRRAQVFTVPADMPLWHVFVTVFQSDDANRATPDQPLQVSLYDADADSSLLTPLWTGSVDPASVSFAPQQLALATGGYPLIAHHHYALALSTTSTQGFYGTARSDGTYDVDPTGYSAVQRLDPASGAWAPAMTPESATRTLDLRYSLSAS